MSEIIIKSVQRSIETGEEIVDETKRAGEFHKIGETVYITYEDVDKENGNKWKINRQIYIFSIK